MSTEPIDVHDTEAASALYEALVLMFGSMSRFISLNDSYEKHQES